MASARFLIQLSHKYRKAKLSDFGFSDNLVALITNCPENRKRYTGHCPTLRFHYGRAYGAKTKEILRELRSKRFREDATRQKYREDDFNKEVLKPIVREKGQEKDYSYNFRHRAPKYITGYTGFIPTLNFRYGKTYGQAADDSMCEFTNAQRRIREADEEIKKIFSAGSGPKMTPIRSDSEVQKGLQEYLEKHKYKEKPISPEDPPIAGYTGHIPRVKGNEESLSQRYHTVVKRGLTLLQQEREKRRQMYNVQKKIAGIKDEVERRYDGKDC